MAEPRRRSGRRARGDYQHMIGMDLLGRDEARQVGPAIAQTGSEPVFQPRELLERFGAVNVLVVYAEQAAGLKPILALPLAPPLDVAEPEGVPERINIRLAACQNPVPGNVFRDSDKLREAI